MDADNYWRVCLQKKYLGFILSNTGNNMKNINDKKKKSLYILKLIIQYATTLWYVVNVIALYSLFSRVILKILGFVT